ncbi:hypothetical protein J7E79_02835 [Bacillus sp. ISL-40]|uniref:hypothetical protein n=1 Tax=unclassified Bacillus (in: firmicutes) TaxID=185979 RepID=UPI001BE786F8|nr:MULTISPECIES: hypothetical protein [unclassified Bacillus (in: firmicutes)]MBT2696372.1 hypothetical protein [Bacillus sp. ISL-40]MBT2743220.1 hypothetical protein [Bacillus sp. ISL-77]
MGILYRACKEVMRQSYIQDLLVIGFTENKEGISVYDMKDEELRHELALATFRKKSIENDQNKWF